MSQQRLSDRRNHQAANDNGLDISYFLSGLYHNRLILIVTAAVISILGLAFVALIPSKYKVAATLVFENPATQNVLSLNDNPSRPTNEASVMATQVALASARELKEKVAGSLMLYKDESSGEIKSLTIANNQRNKKTEDYKISPEVIDYLNKNIVVEQEGKSEIIHVRYTGREPKLSATIVNTYAKLIIDTQRELKTQKINELNARLSDQIAKLKGQTTEKTRQIQQERENAGIISSGKGDANELFYQEISAIQAELTPVQAERIRLQAKYNAIESANSIDQITDVIDSPALIGIKTLLTQTSQKLAEVSSLYQEGHPEYRSARQSYLNALASFEREKKRAKDMIYNDFQTAQRQEALLTGRLENLKREAVQLERNRADIDSLILEESVNEKLLDSLLEGYGLIQAQLELPNDSLRIVSLASIPTSPNSPNRILLSVIVVFFAATLSMGAAIAVHILRDKIYSAEDIQKRLKLRLIAMLPTVKNPANSVFADEKSHYLSEIRRIYLQLQKIQAPQSVLIASVNHGDGASTIASSLSYYISTLNKKAILIEGNTILSKKRKSHTDSTMHQHQEQAQQAVVNVTTGQSEISTVIRKNAANIDILSLGTEKGGMPEQLLLSGNFGNVIKRLEEDYDYVIIDAASINDSTDAEVVASMVDHIFIVVKWGKTTKKALRLAAKNIRRFTETFPFVIINQVK